MKEQEHLFERLARERSITVEEMRTIISARIEKGWNDPDLEKWEDLLRLPPKYQMDCDIIYKQKSAPPERG